MDVIGSYKVEIGEEHLDLFGHVNVLHYYKFFDEAKWRYSTENGFGMNQVKELQQGPVLLEQKIKFISEVYVGETIEVLTHAVEHTFKTTKGVHRLIKPCGALACSAEFTLGYFDMNKRRLVALSSEWKRSTPILTDVNEQAYRKLA